MLMEQKNIIHFYQKGGRERKIMIQIAALFLIGCIFLLLKGQDAVTQGKEKKAAILTADHVQVAFDSVGGRVVEKRVEEEELVEIGDVLMILDSTDVDLEILALEAEIAEMDTQILQNNDSIALGYRKVNTIENKTMTEIQRQKAAFEASLISEENSKRNLSRMKSLYEIGGISKSDFERVLTDHEVASHTTNQQKKMLEHLLEGASPAEIQQVLNSSSVHGIYLSEIAESRQGLANETLGVNRLEKQRERLLIKLDRLKVEKERLTLKSPVSGKVVNVLAKNGEMVNPSSPVVVVETKDFYYDIFVSEDQVAKMKTGDSVTGYGIAIQKKVPGKIRFISEAAEFASMRMSRERGQGDLTSFQVRVYTDEVPALLPGMTIEVDINEISAR